MDQMVGAIQLNSQPCDPYCDNGALSDDFSSTILVEEPHPTSLNVERLQCLLLYLHTFILFKNDYGNKNESKWKHRI